MRYSELFRKNTNFKLSREAISLVKICLISNGRDRELIDNLYDKLEKLLNTNDVRVYIREVSDNYTVISQGGVAKIACKKEEAERLRAKYYPIPKEDQDKYGNIHYFQTKYAINTIRFHGTGDFHIAHIDGYVMHIYKDSMDLE